MTELNESLARMRKAASSLSSTRKAHQAEADETASSFDDDNAAQATTDLKDNAVYQIMSKTNMSGDEQIVAIANYLSVKNDDYASARKRFGEFQAYFNDVQGEGMKLDMKGLEKLIDEMKSALKPEVEKIVKDVVAVQQGVDESKRLIEVMRTARLEGKTIEQIKTAIDLNDQIKDAIKNLSDTLSRFQDKQTDKQHDLDLELDAKIASETGFWNKVARAVKGPDKEIAARIEYAQTALNTVKESITTTQESIKTKETERNTQLESGPLVILRSIDATESGFVESIVDTANQSLALIKGATTSVQRLMKRMAYSKDAAMNISDSIARAEIREAILEGAVQRVAKNSHDQSEGIKVKLGAQDKKLGNTEDDVEKAALNAERVGIAELQKTALAFEEDVKRSHANFTMTTANSVEARTRASNFYNLLLAQEDMLQQVSSRTLPETARALRMGLEVSVGMQTSELASSISTVTRRAIEIGKKNYEDLAKTQDELRAADLKSMQDAIDALNTAQDNVVDAAEKTVKHSGERGNLTGSLGKATDGLRKLLEEYDDIRARAADPGPTLTVDAGSVGDGPARPTKKPANDAVGAPPKTALGS